jgi:hypothetical protein
MPLPTNDPYRVAKDAIESAADSDHNSEARKTASELLTYEYPERVYRNEVTRLQRLVESYHEGLFPGVDEESCEHDLPEHITGRNPVLDAEQPNHASLSANVTCPRCGTALVVSVAGTLDVEAVTEHAEAVGDAESDE